MEQEEDSVNYREEFGWHGGPYDRGAADSYYRRRPNPHKYPNGTGHHPHVSVNNLTDKEIQAYYAGYTDNEALGDFKY